jgi:hypothetical protein
MITSKILALLTVISMLLPQVGINAEISVYNVLGTGEPRPENWERTREYSRFRLTCEDIGDTTTKTFTLNGVLKNQALEDEINAWVINTLETTNLKGVLYTAVNGYMDVTVGMWTGDRYYIRTDAQNAVWNLKTGERVTRFSDLFYEGTDFVPALTEAINNYNNYGRPSELFWFDLITDEPENFSVLTLLTIDPCFDFNPYGGSDRGAAIYSLAAVQDYMPVWFYYDMTELFNSDLGEQVNWSLATMRDNIADEYTTEEFLMDADYAEIYETRIYSPRFLTEDEVNSRNADLEEIYDVIKNSEEYKSFVQPTVRNEEPFYIYEQENYNHSNFPYDLDYRENQGYYDRHFNYYYPDDFIPPIIILVSFPENASKTVIDTPFGAFFKNRETGEIFTPSKDAMLTVSEDFSALLDIDLNGKAEIISLDDGVKILTDEMKPIAEIPFTYAPENFFVITSWVVKKDKKSGEVSGEIYYRTERHRTDEEAKITYEIENGKIIITSETYYLWFNKFENTIKNFVPDDRTETVIYSERWLTQNDIALSGGSAKTHFDALSEQLEIYRGEAQSFIIVYADINGDETNIQHFRIS